MANLTDPADSLTLDLWMAYPSNLSGIFPVDPIDSLQTLYDAWKISVSVPEIRTGNPFKVKVFTDAAGKTVFDFSRCKDYLNGQLIICDITGRSIRNVTITSRIIQVDLADVVTLHLLAYRLVRKDGTIMASGKFIH